MVGVLTISQKEEPPVDDFSGILDFSAAASPPAVADDSEEWVGLEYSIELSTRERHISDTLSHASAGEHSKVILTVRASHHLSPKPALPEPRVVGGVACRDHASDRGGRRVRAMGELASVSGSAGGAAAPQEGVRVQGALAGDGVVVSGGV